MRRYISSITPNLLALLLILFCASEGLAQTTTIRGGGSAHTAAVTAGSLHIRCELGCSGGGGTQYAEDTAHASGDQVTMAGVVQQSADAALSTDGDRSVLQVDANGYLKVNIKAGAGSGGTAMVDDAAFTPATTSGTPAFFLFDDVSPDSVNEGDGGVGRMSANRNQYVTIRDAAGNERGLNIDASGNLTANITGTVTVGSHAVTNAGTFAVQPAGSVAHDAVGTGVNPILMGGYASAAAPSDVSADGDSVRAWLLRSGAQAVQPTFAGVLGVAGNGGSGTGVQRVTLANDSTGVLASIGAISTSITPGTSAAHLGKAEDAAHASGDTGVMSLCVRRDTAATLATTDGDYNPCATDANGRLWTNADTELPAAASLADATSNPTVPGVGAFNMCWNGTTWDRCQKTTDPCQANTKAYANINGTAGATIITGTSAKKIYPCSLVLVTATAQNINLVSGTGTVCGTGTTAILGLSGGTTAGTGWNLSANGGLTLGSGGFALGQTQNNADNLCMLVSGSGQVTGGLSYVVQ